MLTVAESSTMASEVNLAVELVTVNPWIVVEKAPIRVIEERSGAVFVIASPL